MILVVLGIIVSVCVSLLKTEQAHAYVSPLVINTGYWSSADSSLPMFVTDENVWSGNGHKYFNTFVPNQSFQYPLKNVMAPGDQFYVQGNTTQWACSNNPSAVGMQATFNGQTQFFHTLNPAGSTAFSLGPFTVPSEPGTYRVNITLGLIGGASYGYYSTGLHQFSDSGTVYGTYTYIRGHMDFTVLPNLPQAATNPLGVCVANDDGTYTATFSWSDPTDGPAPAQYSSIIDDLSNNFKPCSPTNTPYDGDYCLTAPQTSPITFSAKAGDSYNAIVYSQDADGNSNWIPAQSSFSCPGAQSQCLNNIPDGAVECYPSSEPSDNTTPWAYTYSCSQDSNVCQYTCPDDSEWNGNSCVPKYSCLDDTLPSNAIKCYTGSPSDDNTHWSYESSCSGVGACSFTCPFDTTWDGTNCKTVSGEGTNSCWPTDAAGLHVISVANIGQLVVWRGSGSSSSVWSSDAAGSNVLQTGPTYSVRYSTIGNKTMYFNGNKCIVGLGGSPGSGPITGISDRLPVVNNPNFHEF